MRERTRRDPPAERATAVLFRCWNHGEAMIVRQLLGSYGIACVVAGHLPHVVLPGLGPVRVLVQPSRAAEARALLADHRRQGLRVLPGGKRRKRRPVPRRARLDGGGP